MPFNAEKHAERNRNRETEKIFTMILWGLVIPVESLMVNSITYSLPSKHFKGLKC